MNKYSEKYIYHYCSLETLLSIIKTRKIWFSDLKESNDASEDKALDHLLEIDKNNNILKKEMIKAKQMTSIFGFCLTFKGDNHELWRIYTDNKGVCLKFKKSQFKKFYSNLFGEDKDVYDLQYGKIKYDDIDSQINPSDINYQNISKIYSDFLLKSAFTKKKHWKYEKEYRFCFRKFITDGLGGPVLPSELKTTKPIVCCQNKCCDENYYVKSLGGENKRIILYSSIPFCPYLIDEVIVGENCPISVEKIGTLISSFLGEYLSDCKQCKCENCKNNKLHIIDVKSSIYREQTDEEKWLNKVKTEENELNN